MALLMQLVYGELYVWKRYSLIGSKSHRPMEIAPPSSVHRSITRLPHCAPASQGQRTNQTSLEGSFTMGLLADPHAEL